MKTFLGLRGLLVFLSLMQNCAGDWSAIQVHCSYFWFYARIQPTLFHNLYMSPEEVFLGDDCPVTYVVPDGYEFYYHPHECGITTKTLQETLLFKTKIKYISSSSNDRTEMPLSCVVHSYHHLFNEVEGRNDETTESEWEIHVRIHFSNLAKEGDVVVASVGWPWRNLNVTSPYLSRTYLFHKKINWALHPYSEATCKICCGSTYNRGVNILFGRNLSCWHRSNDTFSSLSLRKNNLQF